MSTLIAITDRNFADELLGTQRTVVVHFRGSRCPLCRWVAAALQVLAAELGETIRLASVATRSCRPLVSRSGIVMIPTLIIFVRRVARLRLRGVFRLDELSSTVRHLSAGAPFETGRDGAG